MIICSECNGEYHNLDDIWFDQDRKPVCKACVKKRSGKGEIQTKLVE